MNNYLNVLVIAVSMLLTYSVVHSETKIYKYVDENGKTVFTSTPPNNSINVEEIELDEANTIPPPQIKAKQNEVQQQHDRVSNRIKERISDREKRTAEIKEAKLEVANKRAALEKGKIPLAGERFGTRGVGISGTSTGNTSRLTKKYHDRVEILAKDLTLAEDKLKELLNKKK